MRNRDQFDYLSLDSYRGIDRHRSAFSTSNPAASLHHRDHPRDTYHRDTYGIHLDYDYDHDRNHYANQGAYGSESSYGYDRNRLPQDWSNRADTSRHGNRISGSDTGYGYGHQPPQRRQSYDYYPEHQRQQYQREDYYRGGNSSQNPGNDYDHPRWDSPRDWDNGAGHAHFPPDNDYLERRHQRDERNYESRDFRGGFMQHQNDF